MRSILATALASVAIIAACASMLAPIAVAQSTTVAPAAAPATAQAARFNGIVSAVSGSEIIATGADGAVLHITAAPDAWIVKGRPIQANDIHAGDFVATANVNTADGAGTSTELRVFPPGLRIGEGSYAMDAPNTTMTNATVAQVTDVSDGRRLTVTYGASAANNSPAGTRTITLPASVQVMQWYRVAPADIQLGERVRGRGVATDGAIAADFIFADNPPAAAPAH